MARIKKKQTKTGTRYQVLHYVDAENGPRERSAGVFDTHAEAKRKKAEIEIEGKRKDAKGKTMAMLFDELLAAKIGISKGHCTSSAVPSTRLEKATHRLSRISL